jgi:hypothetical protein
MMTIDDRTLKSKLMKSLPEGIDIDGTIFQVRQTSEKEELFKVNYEQFQKLGGNL